MPRTVSVNRIRVLVILSLCSLMLFSGGYAATRHTLILANEDEGPNLHVLELLANGAMVTTGQSFDMGYYGPHAIGITPDNRYVWAGASIGRSYLNQFAISPEGKLNPTGRYIGGLSVDGMRITPNGEIMFVNEHIYRAYPDGSVESTANVGPSGAISPQGNIGITLPDSIAVNKIDYSGYSTYRIQSVPLDSGTGATGVNAAFSPDGNDVAIINIGGSSNDIEIFAVGVDGSIDTTHIQSFDMGSNVKSVVFSPDGQYVYVGYDDQLYIAVIRQKTPGIFEDSGIRVPISYWPWQLVISPDNKYLVANGHGILESFSIQADGNLISICQFPFSTIFGHGPMYFQFAYPEAATAVDPLWQLYN